MVTPRATESRNDESNLIQSKPTEDPTLEGGGSDADWGRAQHRRAVHYLALLCFLLTTATLLQTFYLVQITVVFQSQSANQEARLRKLTGECDALNRSYAGLFHKYPALSQYCPVSNSTSNLRACMPCPAGWEAFGEKCYLFTAERQDWAASQSRCLSAGGRLAMVRNEEEQVFLCKKAQGLSQGDSYWLGLRRGPTDRGWQWADNTPLEGGRQFWEEQPGKGAVGELCARLSPGDEHEGGWRPTACSNGLKSICERSQGSMM